MYELNVQLRTKAKAIEDLTQQLHAESFPKTTLPLCGTCIQ